LRVHRNIGNGFLSLEWIALNDIQKTVAEIPAGKPVTTIVQSDLFHGRSVSTPGFLLAALAEERLLVPIQGKKCCHEPVSAEEYRERVHHLSSGKGKQKAASRKKAARQSPASRRHLAASFWRIIFRAHASSLATSRINRFSRMAISAAKQN
jgi:hypothetical protein